MGRRRNQNGNFKKYLKLNNNEMIYIKIWGYGKSGTWK